MNSLKLCIPLQKPTAALLKKAERVGDLVELWADALSQKQLVALIKATQSPVVVTCKDKAEKGVFTGGDQTKIEVLAEAAKAGATYIDCGSHVAQSEVNQLKKSLKNTAAQLILSTHFWTKTPVIEELLKHAKELKKRGADIVKIATTIKSPVDVVTLFELATRLKSKATSFVIVGMGPLSKVARIGCTVLGGEFTFAALSTKYTTAPGQMTVKEVRELVE